MPACGGVGLAVFSPAGSADRDGLAVSTRPKSGAWDTGASPWLACYSLFLGDSAVPASISDRLLSSCGAMG
jgi:hypothetical protein